MMSSYTISVFQKIILAWRLLIAALIASALSFTAAAQGEGPGGGPTSITEVNNLAWDGVQERLEGMGFGLMGDQIDPATGALVFTQTDISIPGNSSLEVAIRRKMAGRSLTPELSAHFSDWQLDVPNMSTNIIKEIGPDKVLNTWDDRCTARAFPDPHPWGLWMFLPDKYWNGLDISIPGMGSTKVLDFPDQSVFGTTSANKATTNNLKFECISDIGAANGGGQGYLVTTPEGTTYKFNVLQYLDMRDKATDEQMVYDFLTGWKREKVEAPQRKAILYASEVTDKNGNWVKYVYNSSRQITKIHSNDGRVIDIFYDGSGRINKASANVDSVSAARRDWIYQYNDYDERYDLNILSRVVQPDGKYWDYNFEEFRTKTLPGECTKNDITVSLTHPYGASATFTLAETRHGYAGTPDKPKPSEIFGNPSGCSEAYTHFVMAWFETMAVTEKTISMPSDPGNVSTWTYAYQQDDGWYGYNPDDTILGGLRKIVMTDPLGNITETYHSKQWNGMYGQLAKVIKKNSDGGVLEQTVNSYESKGEIFGYSHPNHYDTYSAVKHNKFKNYLKTSVVTRDGDTFTTTQDYNNDHTAPDYSFGYPTVSSVSSNVTTTPRVTETTYEHKTGPWILGLPKTQEINNREETRFDYDNQGRKTHEYRYDALVASFGYHSDGTLAWVKDPVNPPHEADNWHRGKPQLVTQPDDNTVSLVVDDNGWVTSSTTAKGLVEGASVADYTTDYEYDEMGRPEKIIPPKASKAWHDTIFEYNFGDDIVQTITKGASKTTVTYDNFFRTSLEKTEDTSGTGWESYVNTIYDANGQMLFKSQPSTSEGETAGTHFTYDDLGRVKTENLFNDGIVEKTHDYLNLHRKRVTDAGGNVTTTYKNGFGETLEIHQPENTTTIITRNSWGQIETVRQEGNHNGFSAGQNQHYVYDNRQRLCTHYTPSGGSVRYAYDNAGQLIASSKGHGYDLTCQIPSGDNLVSYDYDDMSRLIFTNYSDHGTPDTARAYDTNGNLKYLYRQDGGEDEVPWYSDPKFTQWSYDYDELDNLTHETAFLDWQEFDLDYQYNPDGSLFSNTREYRNVFWPAGEGYSHSFVYDRDGMGRGTKVTLDGSALAQQAGYHVSGQLEALKYGNNHIYTQSYNDELLPWHSLTEKGGLRAVDLTYSYNTRGLVSGIIDGIDSNNDRTFGYDGQSRLITAMGPWGAGGAQANGSYIYDAIGNIREKTLGTRNISLTYDDTRNRVTHSIDTGSTGTRSLAYDSRGNVKRIGLQNMTYDASDRPTGVSGMNNGAYRYDGHGRRVKSVTQHVFGENITRYNIYDAKGNLVYVVQDHPTDSSEDHITNYVKMDGKTIARIKTTGSYGNYTNSNTYLHHDHLGSIVSGTSQNGSIAWTEQYTPYGISLVNDAANDNQAGFTGHIKDSYTGLNYMQARYYDPVSGRFLSHDPVQFKPATPGQFNRYAYTWNNPVNANDPDGEFINFVAKFMVDVALEVAIQAASGEDINLGAAAKGAALGVLDPTKTARKVARLGKLANNARKSSTAGKAGKAAGKGDCCFVAGTQVETKEGLRSIETIEVGDYVLSRDPETGETTYKTVTNIIPRHERVIWEVAVTGATGTAEAFETTDEHPWWIVDDNGLGSWKRTDELMAGMSVTTADNQTMVVSAVVETDRIDATYNLTVADFETYFVGTNKVLVHNCRGDAAGLKNKLGKEEASANQVKQIESGKGTDIAGGNSKTPFRDAQQKADDYGGEAGDYAKVKSDAFVADDGMVLSTHAVRNTKTDEIFEAKSIVNETKKSK